MPKEHFPIISLFCGAGGLDCGFRRAGFRTVLACDNFPAAIQSYNFNAKRKVAHLTDLSKATADEICKLMGKGAPAPVGVIGGPPCQGFSRGNAFADPDDPRNQLPMKYADLLADLNDKFKLKFFVFENVMGLANPLHSVRFLAIRQAFEDAGFTVFNHALDAADFGVAQRRRRLFIVGLNKKAFKNHAFVFPTGNEDPVTVKDVIRGLPKPCYFARGTTSRDIGYHPNHWTMQPRSAKLVEGGTPTDGRSFRRLEWNEVSPTVAYGNREIHVHPNGGRRLSVLEAMLLQGFPKTYRLIGNLSEQITQVCNAVPPPVAEALARTIRAVILSQRAKQKRARRQR